MWFLRGIALVLAHGSVIHGDRVVSPSTVDLFLKIPFEVRGFADLSRSLDLLFNLSHESKRPTQMDAPLSLHDLRRGKDVLRARDCLTLRGFCWLEIDDEVGPVSMPALAAAERFLAQEGGTGLRGALTGHYSAAHKDGFRLLTGDLLRTVDLPAAVAEPLWRLAAALDAAQADVARGLMPLLEVGAPTAWKSRAALFSGRPRYGFLDLARYVGEGAPRVLVDPHADPGLLLLGLPSSGPGLEFQDEAGRWVAPPRGQGVLWAGRAAGAAVPAMHRVAAVTASRFAVWHELGTRRQIAPPMLEDLGKRGLELTLGGLNGTRAVLEALRAAEDHMPDGGWLHGPMGLSLSKVLSVSTAPMTMEEFQLMSTGRRVLVAASAEVYNEGEGYSPRYRPGHKDYVHELLSEEDSLLESDIVKTFN